MFAQEKSSEDLLSALLFTLFYLLSRDVILSWISLIILRLEELSHRRQKEVEQEKDQESVGHKSGAEWGIYLHFIGSEHGTMALGTSEVAFALDTAYHNLKFTECTNKLPPTKAGCNDRFKNLSQKGKQQICSRRMQI